MTRYVLCRQQMYLSLSAGSLSFLIILGCLLLKYIVHFSAQCLFMNEFDFSMKILLIHIISIQDQLPLLLTVLYSHRQQSF